MVFNLAQVRHVLKYFWFTVYSCTVYSSKIYHKGPLESSSAESAYFGLLTKTHLNEHAVLRRKRVLLAERVIIDQA